MANNLSIFADALVETGKYKNLRVNGELIGVGNARKWAVAVKACRIPAYAVRVYRYNHMGDATVATPCDQTPLYTALADVLEMVGVVNGAKLDAHNVAEEIISNAMKFRVIDTSEEMAHAHSMRREAKKAMNENECDETIAEFETWDAECKRLEELPGNCKKIPEIQADNAFVKAVEKLLCDAITKQTAKSAEQVAAEEEAKRAERRAKTKAKREALKAAKAHVANVAKVADEIKERAIEIANANA